jgi:hypothetical protein
MKNETHNFTVGQKFTHETISFGTRTLRIVAITPKFVKYVYEDATGDGAPWRKSLNVFADRVALGDFTPVQDETPEIADVAEAVAKYKEIRLAMSELRLFAVQRGEKLNCPASVQAWSLLVQADEKIEAAVRMLERSAERNDPDFIDQVTRSLAAEQAFRDRVAA